VPQQLGGQLDNSYISLFIEWKSDHFAVANLHARRAAAMGARVHFPSTVGAA
jgi:hypothetical protein